MRLLRYLVVLRNIFQTTHANNSVTRSNSLCLSFHLAQHSGVAILLIEIFTSRGMIIAQVYVAQLQFHPCRDISLLSLAPEVAYWWYKYWVALR
jgi:hypothetical protein